MSGWSARTATIEVACERHEKAFRVLLPVSVRTGSSGDSQAGWGAICFFSGSQTSFQKEGRRCATWACS